MFDSDFETPSISEIADRAQTVARSQWFRVLATLAIGAFLVATIVNHIVAAQLASMTVPKLPPYSMKKGSSGGDSDGGTPAAKSWDDQLAGRCFFGCDDSPEPEDKKKTCPDGCDDGEKCEEGECVPIEEKPEKPESDVPVESDIDVKLLGCMVADDPRYSMALIQDGKSEETYVVRPGDMLPKEARVLKVERDRIYIERKGRKEYIQLASTIGGEPSPVSISKSISKPTVNPSRTGANKGSRRKKKARKRKKQKKQNRQNESEESVDQVSSNEYKVPKKKLQKKLDNPRDLVKEAKAVPNYEDDKRKGLKMVSVSPSGMFSELGFQSGDVIHSIDGEQTNSQQDAMKMLERLKSKNSVSVTVERNGEKREHRYELE